MNIFLDIFTNTLLPTLILAGVGFLLSRWLHPDRRSLTAVIMNAFFPCMIFQGLTQTDIPLADFGQMALFALLVMAISALLGLLMSVVLRLNRALSTMLVMMLMFANVGNMGLPVVTLAYGQEALTYATIFFVTSNLTLYSLGLLIASSGRESVLTGLRRLARMPFLYAVLAAGLFQWAHWQLPTPLETAVNLLARAGIPTMLLLLGMQLQSAGFKITGLVSLGTLARLVVTPALVWLANGLVGLSGAALQAGMIESAMPSGVMVSILAVEYDLAPEFAANMVLLTTLLSPLTLTLLITLLQGRV